jgi:Flp pilus assembly protein TadG
MKHGRSSLRYFASDARATTAVEFAMVAAPFIACLIAILQTGLVYLSNSALETATEKAGRMILTGTAQLTAPTAMTQAQFVAAACTKLPSLLKCANLMVDVMTYTSFSAGNTATPTLTYNPDGTVSNVWNYTPGSPGDIVVLRLLYLMPVVGGPLNFALSNQPGGKRLLMATAVFKNEPYQ